MCPYEVRRIVTLYYATPMGLEDGIMLWNALLGTDFRNGAPATISSVPEKLHSCDVSLLTSSQIRHI
jgi:hypothetical protein